MSESSIELLTKLKDNAVNQVSQSVGTLRGMVDKAKETVIPTGTSPDGSAHPVAKESEEKKDKEPYEDKEEDDANDEVSFSRILKKIWKYIKLIVTTGFFPLLAFLLAVYVSNEMIVYPAAVRFAFFVFVFILSWLIPPVAVVLGFYYLCKAGYSYYVNDMGNGPKQRIMPYIFAWLPITTRQYNSRLQRFFMYPFTYPKTPEDAAELPEIMKEYQEALDKSFDYLKKLNAVPFFVDGVKKIKGQFATMHEPILPPPEETEAVTTANQPPPLPNVIPPSNARNQFMKNLNANRTRPLPAVFGNKNTTSSAESAPANTPAAQEPTPSAPPAESVPTNTNTIKSEPKQEQEQEQKEQKEPKQEQEQEPKQEQEQEQEQEQKEPKQEQEQEQEPEKMEVPMVIPSQNNRMEEESSSLPPTINESNTSKESNQGESSST